MNEDGTPIEEIEESTENITAADGGITTTPEEVAELLHLPVAPKEADKPADDEDEENIEDKTEIIPPVVAETEDKPVVTPEKPVVDNADVPTFELEVEDTNGTKFTLKPGDDLETVLKDFEPKSNGQIFAILEKLNDLKSEKSTYDKDQATKAEEAAKTEQLASIQSGWDKEIQLLQGSKRLEMTTDGKPSERVNEVFAYMNTENSKRIADGRPLVQSFEDALDKLELKETKEAAIEKAKEEKELAKKRGGMVGGSSAPATSGAPVYKGGARNANEAMRSMGILK